LEVLNVSGSKTVYDNGMEWLLDCLDIRAVTVVEKDREF
jgi:hypothetical protein